MQTVQLYAKTALYAQLQLIKSCCFHRYVTVTAPTKRMMTDIADVPFNK